MSGSDIQKNKKIIPVVAMAMRFVPTGEYLLARRAPHESGAGAWEFPGGKVEFGEQPLSALRREIQEELGHDIGADAGRFLAEHEFAYPDKTISLSLWLVEVHKKPQFTLVDHDQTVWVSADSMQEMNLSAGDKPFVSLLK